MNQFMTVSAPDGSRSGPLAREAATALAASHIPETSSGPGEPAAIAVLCQAAGRPDMAAQLIRARSTLQAVRAQLASEAPMPAPTPVNPATRNDRGITAPTAAAPAAAPPVAAQPAARIDARKIYVAHRAEMARRAANVRS